MPIYEYKCRECGFEFEELVFNRDECPKCPKCGSPKTEKLMSACKAKTGTAESGDWRMPLMPSGVGGGG